MDEWLSGHTGNDPDGRDGSNLSIDEIVAAFREALVRERGQSTGRPEQSRQASDLEGSGRGHTDRPPPTPGPENEQVRNTIAAFRKARRREQQDETTDRSDRARSSEGRRTDRRGREEPRSRKEEPSGEEPSERDASIEGAIENFAPAFRDALKQRDESEHDDSGADAEGDRPDDGGAGEPSVEQAGRAGDGVPPSDEVEVSRGGRSASGAGAGSRPARPDNSFLWVTGHSEGDSTSVSIDNLADPRALEADAFLLEGAGHRPYELLTRIRGHSEMNVYLKPVFWRHRVDQDSRVAQHVDGDWTQDDRSALDSLHQRAASINRRIRNMAGSGAREERGMELRVLRFIATRGHEFTPSRTTENPDGFVYPQLTPLLERASNSGGGELVQILSMLEERRLLTGEFVMRQHACHNCGSGFLNFEEMCPHCGATDLDTDDLVHHFRCAFTGALNEYKQEQGQLVCPKCDRALKQIGVDYDKPSVVHTCRRCHEQFQDPEVQTTCYNCGRTNPPEQQIDRQVKKYKITALGEETAVYGLSDSLLSTLERESRVLDYATFQLIAESEAARIERYQRSASCLLLVRVAGLQQMRMEIGQRSQEVVQEIATAFDNTLRSSDYLSARDESLYLFLLTETGEQGARRAGERLEQNIEGVLGQNLQHPPNLKIAVQPLHPDLDLDSIAETFLAQQGRDRAAVTAG